MKLVHKGKFNGDENSLPAGPHKEGAVRFKEFENTKQMGIFGNIAAMLLMVICITIFILRSGSIVNFNLIGCLLSLVCMYPHELLHAVCFKETAYIYTNLSQGMLFVVGTEPMSKARFIFMNLCPNLVFGFIPFILFLIQPDWTILGTLGTLAIGMGAVDYYNVFNALTQMPKGAKTYLHKMNSYWYMPSEE